MKAVAHFIRCWKLKRQLERNLAARKLLRPQRRAAALKGWNTRRAA